MYTDKDGNAFYIDGSSVPNLSPAAISAYKKRLKNDPVTAALHANQVVLLDGSTSRDDWVKNKCGSLVPYSQWPKLRRDDYVQNSNDSYWATNPKDLMTGYSPLYGAAPSQLSTRTRMGLTMLTHPKDSGLSNVKPAGPDGKFSAKDIINMLYSNRAYLAERLLPDLLKRCSGIGDKAVDVSDNSSRPVAKGCKALKSWNGVFNTDSTGAGTFRVFVGHYQDDALPGDYQNQFDPDHPITTPGDPKPAPNDLSKDPMLQALAEGLNDLDKVNIAYDAKLGDIQVQRTSGGAPPGGMAQFTSARIPWPGGQNLEGAFDVVQPITSSIAQDTRYPIKIEPDTIPDTGDLSTKSKQGWLVNVGTSFHFGLEFKDSGPVAYGLLSYSESTNPNSPYYNDQDHRFSQKNYRTFEFTKSQIEADPNLKTVKISAKH
jgi:acyl-homoserine-lactone acylase